MSNKTPEEIAAAVMAYCKQVGMDGDFLIRDRLWLIQDFDGFTCQRQNKANQGTQVFAVSERLSADDPYWAVAYSVLGLETRNAVNALKAKEIFGLYEYTHVAESYKADINGLRADLNDLRKSYNEEVAKFMKAYNALNVAQAEIRALYIRLGYLDGTALRVIDEAMEAYKKETT